MMVDVGHHSSGGRMSRPRHVVSGQLGPARCASQYVTPEGRKVALCSKCEHVGRSVLPVKWQYLR